jgi:hypothetical protein
MYFNLFQPISTYFNLLERKESLNRHFADKNSK